MAQRFGRYNLLEFLASGGMADVYRAEAPGPDGFAKELAIKVLRGDFADRPEFLEMFKQEARLASKLTHANIVQVFDFGQAEDGRKYIAMELVRGRTLGQVMGRCRSLPVPIKLGLPRALHVCTQVATALGYAHRRTEGGRPLGLVHRDVSPQNVLISFEGEVKLADFGIARVMTAGGITRPGVIKGKPAYVAPEQARGLEIDARADLFALGIILWELACGFNLFERDSDVASLMAVVGPDPPIPPASKWNPEVPPELDQAILSALERDPARRTQSAEQLASQLQSILLKLAKGSEDLDLRALMRELWPEEATSPGRARVATQRMATPEPPPAPAAGAVDTSSPSPGLPAAPQPAQSGRARLGRAAWLAGSGALALLAAGALAALVHPFAEPRRALPGPSTGTPSRGLDGGGRPAAELPPASPTGADLSPDAGRHEPAQPDRPERVSRAKARPPTPAPHDPRPEPAQGEAKLRVFSTSTWAIIYVDGERVGFTPVTKTVSAGRHQVRAEHEEYPPVEETITLKPGEERRWSPQFRSP